MSDKLDKMITNVIEVEKNGVKVVIKQQYNKEINDINIDFSSHDKVFEDKIAKCEEAIGYYKDSFYRAEKNCDKLYHENQELKQRIAELESKKRKRPCFVSYVGVEEINGKEYVSMEKFATAMEELNAYFDKFFDS